ncbi:MAG TPA: hypothetical protein VNE39_23320 [Planctomycetota bacterium]|nr:hypothetical protein [Planctomycetota bacterium]
MALPWRPAEPADGAGRRPRWSKRALVILGIAVLLTWVFALFAALRLGSERREFEDEAEAIRAELRAARRITCPPK